MAPSSFQMAMFQTLAPAILVVPLFCVFGKGLLGGPRIGFYSVVVGGTSAMICFVYHVVLFFLLVATNHLKRGIDAYRDFYVSQLLAMLLCLYFGCHLLLQISMEDHNASKEEPGWREPSILESLCDQEGTWLCFRLALLGLAFVISTTTILAWCDLLFISYRRMKTE